MTNPRSPRFANRLFLLLVSGLLLALVMPTLVSAQEPQPLHLDRAVSPEQGTLGKIEFDITLTLQGDIRQCPPTTTGRPADILLVIDHSPSMFEPAGGGASGNKMELLQVAAKNFVRQANLGRDQIGIVEFDQGADVAHPLGTDRTGLENAIDALNPGNGTAIDQGIIMAHREFSTARARDKTSYVMVLLTDGIQSTLFPGGSGPVDAAQAAKRDGIRIVTIGLGADADHDTLKQVASTAEDYYFAPRATDLKAIYEKIGSTVSQPPAASDVIFEHTYDASAVEIIPETINPPGAVNGDTITWSWKEVADAPVVFSYRARPLAAGTFRIDRGDRITYNRCGNTPATLEQPAALPVTVQQPPTRTRTATPTATNTPRPTNTRAPTPLPTPTLTPLNAATTTMTNFFCESPLLLLCLLLPLLLFLLWWLLRLRRELAKPAGERNLCNLIPLLLIPLFLILLWFIWNALASGLCIPRDSIYFWRIGQGESAGRIFVTDKEGAQPAREFAGIGTGKCTGCHAVSSTSHRIAAVAGGGSAPIVVYGLDGKSENIPAVTGSYVAWSPEGKQLAVSTEQRDIVIVDLERGTVTPLEGASDPDVFEEMPNWSPDGETIAFVRGTVSNTPWSFEGPADIYTVPATGGTATPVEGASGDGFNYYPAYSPDGKWIAFTRHTTGKSTYSAPEAEIFLVPPTGGERIRLAANDADGKTLENASNSWPTWSRTGDWLAFNSKRNDSAYDIFITFIDENGNSSPAQPVKSAAVPQIFEHLPFQGEPPQIDPIPALLALWPCLIPFLLVLLAWLLCRWFHRTRIIPVVPPQTPARIPPGPLPPVMLEPLWQVAPTLILGVGGTGRWVLTHLKKALSDGGLGQLPPNVQFRLLDTSEREETNVLRNAQNEITGVEFAGVELVPDEMLLMNQSLATSVRQGAEASDAALSGWFPFAQYRGLPDSAFDLSAGTGGRRPMARAGLIDKLRRGFAMQETSADSGAPYNDAARLWATLVHASEQVRDGDRIRIILVGSLAGGMSGTLFDLAYLARRAARGVVGDKVHLEACLTTPGVFRNAATPDQLQINAAAAARELERFQLSQGFAFPFNYASNNPSAGAQAPLSGSCDWRLFDDVTLFGGAGEPEHGSTKSNEPWATTFASIADVISFRLDRAVKAGENADYRWGLRSRAETKQKNSGLAVGASAGSYVYRLPLVDILELVHTRWARKLFHVFLNGDVNAMQPSFNPADAGMSETAEEYAQKFVLGEHPAGDPPRGVRIAGLLAGGNPVTSRQVQELTEESGRPYGLYLGHALGLILNGEQVRDGTTVPLDRRAPRIGYAVAFVTTVRNLLQQALQNARSQRNTVTAGQSGLRRQRAATPDDWESAIKRIEGWLEISSRSLDSLEGNRRLIVGMGEGSKQPGAQGLYSELVVRQSKAENRRSQMDRVAVRRYLWAKSVNPLDDPADPQNRRDLADDWYAQIEPRISDYLGRLYWTTTKDGNVSLGVVAFDAKGKAITLDAGNPDSVHRLADELIRLASSLTRDRVEAIKLGDVLATEMGLRETDAPTHFIERIWRHAMPHLAPAADANQNIDGLHIAAAGVPPVVQDDKRVNASIEALRGLGTPTSRFDSRYAPVPATVISTTDRTALTLVREYALMPLQNLPELQEAYRVYGRNAGSVTDRESESPLRAAVFSAERRALDYERRLEAPEVVDQDLRRLHPLVVIALERGDLAELYVLAFAANWILGRGGVAQLTIPGTSPVTLDMPGFDETADPLVLGLLRFTAGKPEDADLVERVRGALKSPDSAVMANWRQFVEQYHPTVAAPVERRCVNGHLMSPGERFCGECGEPVVEPAYPSQPAGLWQPPFQNTSQAMQDLAAVAAIAAYRRLAPDEWDNIVMRRARRV